MRCFPISLVGDFGNAFLKNAMPASVSQLGGFCPRFFRGFLCLAAVLAGFGEPAFSQDILIFRPVNNARTEVKTPTIVFEVEASAFSPILELKINGKVQRITPATSVAAKTPLFLKPGKNTILVEVRTADASESREFPILLKLPGVVEEVAEKKKAFLFIAVLGAQFSDNALKVSPGNEPISAVRSFLILIPSYDWVLSKRSTLKFQAILSRDQQDKSECEKQSSVVPAIVNLPPGTSEITPETSDTLVRTSELFSPAEHCTNLLTDEEIAFSQVAASWIVNFNEKDSWTLGIGYNLIGAQFDNFADYKVAKERDGLLFTSFQKGFGSDNFFDLALELKVQKQDELKVKDLDRQIENATAQEGDLLKFPKLRKLQAQRGAFDPLDSTYNPDDLGDADVYTLKAKMEAGFLIFRGKLQAAYSVTDALGKFKDKATSRLSAEIGLPLGKLILGLGVRGRRNTFKEIDTRLFRNGTPREIATPTTQEQKTLLALEESTGTNPQSIWRLKEPKEETLITAFFTAILPLSDSWIVSLEALSEEQTTNVYFPGPRAAALFPEEEYKHPFPSGEYKNSAVSTSLIFIF